MMKINNNTPSEHNTTKLDFYLKKVTSPDTQKTQFSQEKKIKHIWLKKHNKKFHSHEIELRETSDFELLPCPRPENGSTRLIQFFREKKTKERWLGKCAEMALVPKDRWSILQIQPDFICIHLDEIREKLAMTLYHVFGVEVPESTLSAQPFSNEIQQEITLLYNTKPADQSIHYLSHFIENLSVFGPEFLDFYLNNPARQENKTYAERDGLPFKGLGRLLAVADLLDDVDCFGHRNSNIGYLIKQNSSGERYAQIFKLDGGYAFAFHHVKGVPHDPRTRDVRVSPSFLKLNFSSLFPGDQKEFIETACHILATPKEELQGLFAQTELTGTHKDIKIPLGIPQKHWMELFSAFCNRRELFLAAFAKEIDAHLQEILELSSDKALLIQLRQQLQTYAETHNLKIDTYRSFPIDLLQTPFIERKKDLQNLAETLWKNQIVGMIGDEGVGKTSLACSYARLCLDTEKSSTSSPISKLRNYQQIIYFDANLPLDKQLTELLTLWVPNFPMLHHQCQADLIDSFYRFLNSFILCTKERNHSLIIFDHVSHENDISPYLLKNLDSNIRILIIYSPSSSTSLAKSIIKLENFSKNETQFYIEKFLEEKNYSVIEKTHQILNGNPTLLAHAVHWIQKQPKPYNLKEFLEEFLSHSDDRCSKNLLINTAIRDMEKNPIAKEILQTLPYLSLNINTILISKLLKISHKDIIEIIKKSNLFCFSLNFEKVTLFPFVQKKLFLQYRNQHILTNVLDILSTEMLPNIEASRSLIPHVEHLIEISKELSLTQEQEIKLAKLLKKSAEYQQITGRDYNKQLIFLKKLLEITVKHHEENSLEVAEIQKKLADNYGNLKNFKEQLKILKKILPIFENTNHWGNVLTDLGAAYWHLSENEMAKLHLEKALQLDEEVLKPTISHQVLAHTILSKLYGQCSDHQQQSIHLNRTSDLLCINLVDLNIINSCTILSQIYKELNQTESQIKILKKLIDFKESYYGKENLEIYSSLINLARSLRKLGNHQESENILEKAHTISKKYNSPDSPEMGIASGELGITHVNLANNAIAEIYLNKAIEIIKKHKNKKNFQLYLSTLYDNRSRAIFSIETHFSIVTPKEKNGKKDAERAFDIRKEQLGEKHKLTKNTKRLLELWEVSSSPNFKDSERKLKIPVKEAACFLQAIVDFFPHLEIEINKKQKKTYNLTIPELINSSLQALQMGMWDEFQTNPEAYDVPESLQKSLNVHVSENPILFHANGELHQLCQSIRYILNEEILNEIQVRDRNAYFSFFGSILIDTLNQTGKSFEKHELKILFNHLFRLETVIAMEIFKNFLYMFCKIENRLPNQKEMQIAEKVAITHSLAEDICVSFHSIFCSCLPKVIPSTESMQVILINLEKLKIQKDRISFSNILTKIIKKGIFPSITMICFLADIASNKEKTEMIEQKLGDDLLDLVCFLNSFNIDNSESTNSMTEDLKNLSYKMKNEKKHSELFFNFLEKYMKLIPYLPSEIELALLFSTLKWADSEFLLDETDDFIKNYAQKFHRLPDLSNIKKRQIDIQNMYRIKKHSCSQDDFVLDRFGLLWISKNKKNEDITDQEIIKEAIIKSIGLFYNEEIVRKVINMKDEIGIHKLNFIGIKKIQDYLESSEKTARIRLAKYG